MEIKKVSLVVIFLSIFLLSSCDCSEILILAPFPSPSHWLMIKHLIEELLSGGHHITAVTSLKYNSLSNSNYTEVLIDPKYDMHNFSMYKLIFYFI